MFAGGKKETHAPGSAPREGNAGQTSVKSAGVRAEGAVRPLRQAPAVVQPDAACPEPDTAALRRPAKANSAASASHSLCLHFLSNTYF